jgi:hypothetical protein
MNKCNHQWRVSKDGETICIHCKADVFDLLQYQTSRADGATLAMEELQAELDRMKQRYDFCQKRKELEV